MTPSENKARAAWGKALPDWVSTLAEECDRTSQRLAAGRIGYSGATVSLVLGNTYRGDLARVEEAVRANLMQATVACPAAGDLSLSQCLDWRRKAKVFAPTSSQRARMFRACNACPRFKGG